MDAIKQYELKDGKRLSIYYDECMQDPRVDDDNLGKLCIRKHSRYFFPNELNFDFGIVEARDNDDDDYYKDRAKEEHEKLKNYWVFELDCYEHSGVVFSLTGTGMQCNFDTSNNVGFIALPKEYNSYDLVEWEKSNKKENEAAEKVVLTKEEARKKAEKELNRYNKYINGEGIGYVVKGKVKWTSEDGREKEEREEEDSCRGYYNIEDIEDEFESVIVKEI